jgi:hypothetical protein
VPTLPELEKIPEGGRLGHPWELTLRQFVEKVTRDYGLLFEVIPLPVPGTILVRGTRVYALPGIDEDDVLDVASLEAVCDYYDLPRADFHLDPKMDED